MSKVKLPIEVHEPGTLRGYRWHERTRTVPCKACCHARAVYAAELRDRGRCAKGLGWPLVTEG